MADHPAGPEQIIATYGTAESQATKGSGLSRIFMDAVSADAGRRASDGWRIVSWDTLSSRYGGTPGSVLLNTGEGYPEDVIITMVYARQP